MFIHQKKHVYLFGLLEILKGRCFASRLEKTISVRVVCILRNLSLFLQNGNYIQADGTVETTYQHPPRGGV